MSHPLTVHKVYRELAMSQQTAPGESTNRRREGMERLYQHGGPAHYMTLRDHFAGLALEGMIAGRFQPGFIEGLEVQEAVAQAAYLYADAMLTARSK